MNLTYRLSKKSRVLSDQITVFEVMARYHSGGFDQYAKTGVFVPASFTDRNGNKKLTWAEGFVVIPKISYADDEQIKIRDILTEAKDRLKEIDADVSRALSALQVKNEKPYKGWLQDVINGDTGDDDQDAAEEKPVAPPLCVALSNFINGHPSLSRGSIMRYKTLRNTLQRYEADRGVVLTFDGLSPEQLQDFRAFVKDEDGVTRSDNYIVTMFHAFRTFVRWANGLGKGYRIDPLTTNNPFDLYSIGSEQYGTPFYLTIEERNLLEAFDFPQRLARQRDIFVFQCLIGCRVSDLWSMTKANIVDGAIEYIPKKTKEERPITVRVPLNSHARAILDKYKDNGDERLFPFVAQQQYNLDIKDMLEKAGITRMVTVLDPVTREEVKRRICDEASSHLARRTFIGNLYKHVKDPNLVGKLSGHSEGSKAFARYRDIDDDMAKELVSMLE